MKKLIYMLSLTIGLMLAGCAQWEKPVPQSPDNFGTASELTVTIDSVLTTTTLPFTIEVKGATYVAYTLVENAIENLDYTRLVQGQLGAKLVQVANGDTTVTGKYEGLEYNKVYTFYAVSTNEQGRQTTFAQSIQTKDETAPVIVKMGEPLTAASNFKSATVVFNENIIRKESMGAITYDVYKLDRESKAFVHVVENTAVASASASGTNLTVTLPSTQEFEVEVEYLVLLSFAEGAVEDAFGNKMAAIANEIVNNKATGPFWNVKVEEDGDDEPVVGESFFVDGAGYAYFLGIDFSGEGQYQEAGTDFLELSLISEGFELEGLVCNVWTMPSILNMFTDPAEAGVTPNQEVPVLTYISETSDGYETEFFSIYDPETPPVLGQMVLTFEDGTEDNVDVYPGQYDPETGSVYYGWDFALYEFQDQQGNKFPGLAYYGREPVMFFVEGQSAYFLAEIEGETFQLHREDIISAGVSYKMFDKPVKFSADQIRKRDASFVQSLKLKK